MYQPTKEWVNKVNLSSFEHENFSKFGACVISARKAKQVDATTMFTYSHANTALGQSERAYYLSYFIKEDIHFAVMGHVEAALNSQSGLNYAGYCFGGRIGTQFPSHLCQGSKRSADILNTIP